MKYNYGFTISLDEVFAGDVIKFVSILMDIDKFEDDINYVSWNYFGNYVMFSDDYYTIYICKNYVRINGLHLYTNKELNKSIEFLKQFKVI